MAKPSTSNVDVWLGRETPPVRKALENASRSFDTNDQLTVNTLDKKVKEKDVRQGKYRCTEGHWVTIDDRPVFICD